MICGTCGEPVRFGVRNSEPGWWHREARDHPGFPVIEPEHEPPPVIPAPEVTAEPFDPADLPPRSGIRQVTNLLTRPKDQKAYGWRLVSLTRSRGPYVGAKGTVLSISDSLLVRAGGPVRLDGSVPVAVASWKDGAFDFAYIGEIRSGHLSPVRVNFDETKHWIKGIHDSPAALIAARDDDGGDRLPDAVPEGES